MVKIAPSLLTADFCALGRDIDRVSCADWLHLDVMDGLFVPNLSFGLPVVKSIRRYTSMFLDVHLMIQQPGRYVEALAMAGADQLTVHLESDAPEALSAALDRMETLGVKRGVVLKPGTPAQAAFPYLDRGLDTVLVMTVEPGFGGQPFLLDQLPKMAQLRAYIDAHCPGCLLEVDGGVNPDTAKLCVSAGVDVLVAGGAIFGAPEPEAVIQQLREA